MLKADDFRLDTKEIHGWQVNITSYKIGSKFFCHVANVDPGTTIVRTEGETYNEAYDSAISIAQQRLTSKTHL